MDICFGNSKAAEVTSALTNVSFSFYSSNEINRLSIVEILCPAFFNSDDRVIEWGLCDLRLGASSKKEHCFSCSEIYSVCPGHFGHIDLALPVTNPLIKNILNSILNSKCWYCNHFRLSGWKIKLFYIRLLVLDLGLHIRIFHMPFFQFLHCILNTGLDFKYNLKIINLFEEKLKKKVYQHHFFDFFLIDRVFTQKDRNRFINSFLQKSTASQFCYRCKKIKTLQENKNLLKMITMKKNFRNLVFFNKVFLFYSVVNEVCFEEFSKFFYHNNNRFQFKSFQVKKHVYNLWKCENNFFELLWGCGLKFKKFKGKNNHEMFFINKILVPPTRFRPVYTSKIFKNKQKLFSNSQNFYFLKIIKLNQQLLLTIGINVSILKKIIGYNLFSEYEKVVLDLFDNPNSLFGFSKKNPIGIRQQLEKKLGLFRMHLMGKRVSYSARTIVVPNPFLKSNQVGFPLICARKINLAFILNRFNLHFFIKSMNTESIKKIHLFSVENIETVFGEKFKILQNLQLIHTCRRYFEYYICKRLNNFGLTKFFRTLRSQDLVLLNRQPSLHRSSIMAHKVVLKDKTKCLSLNYMNCASYNADFDGDEMNVHIIHSCIAKAEALILSLTDNHIKIPTHSLFIRSLIQDYIISAVHLTSKCTFFKEDAFFHLLYSVFNENFIHLNFCPPSIVKPKALWTGKQLISMVIKNLFSSDLNVCFESRNKIHRLTQGQDETLILIRNGELLRGILDSSQLGKSKHGIIHAFYENYGPKKTDTFLTYLGLFFILFQRSYGHTTGLSDLIVSYKIDRFRTKAFHREKIIKKILIKKILSKKGFFLRFKSLKTKNIFYFLNFASFLFIRKISIEHLILYLRSLLIKISTNLIESNLPENLEKDLNQNNFLTMVLSGAKGSFVNFFQICTSLGQMEFEGNFIICNKMAKTLPFFFPFEISAESSGFIFQRFLTGLSSFDYFFHCMAGRESLLDTTIKTSQSGYIQRNLIKHLENLKLNYDLTVKTGADVIIQFIYSRDGLNPIGFDFDFCLSWYLQNLIHNFTSLSQNPKYFKKNIKMLKKYNTISPLKILLCLQKISGQFYKKKKFINGFFRFFLLDEYLFNFYQKNLHEPGEPIGIVASQSIGEPCTQMTLNTFHLAGKIAACFSIGIPRLKEILLLASKYPKNPTTSIYFRKDLNFKDYTSIQKRLKGILLSDLIQTVIIYKKKFHLTIKIRLISKNRYKHQLLLDIFFIKNQIKNFWKNIESKILLMFNILKSFKIQRDSQMLSFLCAFDERNKNFNANNCLVDIIQIEFLKIYNLAFSFYFKRGTMVDFSFIDFREKLVHFKGINFYVFWANFDLVNINKLLTNDIYEVLLVYGVEACRKMLFEELENIFQIQAILINKHHINLISDYMTKMGMFKPFNRMEMNEEKGFQRITYETALNFIIDAAVNKIFDKIDSASSSVCMGKICSIGSGYFDISCTKRA